MGKNLQNGPSMLCCYCGLRVATTKDHIPPKAIFTKPRPNDLITVPCCFECNNGASRHDELFKAYIGMHVARQRGEAEILFKKGVIPTLMHNQALKERVFSSMKKVNSVTPSGQLIQNGVSVKWDSDAHDTVILRLIKGLFFHHNQVVLPVDLVDIQVYFFNAPLQVDFTLNSFSIANGKFKYHFALAEDVLFSSVWLFEFYNGHWAGGITLPR